MKKVNIVDLLIFIISTELIGAVSGLLAGNISMVYASLEKPPFAPPGVVFPIVWAVLYALMGISAYLIYNTDDTLPKRSKALLIYAVQLLVNFSWSIFFFRFELFCFSVVIIVLLLILNVAMFFLFKQIKPAAAFINIPYILWILFATYLNIGFCVLN